MRFRAKKILRFFSGVIFGRSCRSDFLEFSANFDVEDWKMTLEELRLGYSNLWDQTWNFSKRSVETGKLQHSHSAVSLFPSIFSTTSLAASCFSEQIHVDIPKEDVGMTGH